MGARRDRCRGALFGLAVGDALGATLEFRAPGSFEPITDMVGGGPHRLKPGRWTDDTAMALCLAESLIERRGMDPADQMRRYVRWYRDGYHSSTGRCFDIGNQTRAALERFEQSGDPFAGDTAESSSGNGSIMRLAPVPIWFVNSAREALDACAESSRTTHGSRQCVDACRLLGALILGALRGVAKEELLAPGYAPVPGCWDQHPLTAEIAEIAAGSYRRREPPEIQGSGYVARSLEAALWAFHRSSDFRSGALMAANLGDDADTTAAVFGQVAGAYYGESGIPQEWLGKVAKWVTIDRLLAGLTAGRGTAEGSSESVPPRSSC